MPENGYTMCERKVNFECQRCGRCCTDFFVPIGESDLMRLQGNAGDMKGKTVTVDSENPITGNEVSSPSLIRPCPFFDKETTDCRVYGFRPKTCIIFPFFVKKEKGKMAYFHSVICPGIGKGPKVDLFPLLSVVRKLEKDIRKLKEKSAPAGI